MIPRNGPSIVKNDFIQLLMTTYRWFEMAAFSMSGTTMRTLMATVIWLEPGG